MTTKVKETINFNSVLLTIVLAISAWTLKKVTEQAEIAAGTIANVQNQGKAIEALDQRVSTNTRDISDLRATRK